MTQMCCFAKGWCCAFSLHWHWNPGEIDLYIFLNANPRISE